MKIGLNFSFILLINCFFLYLAYMNYILVPMYYLLRTIYYVLLTSCFSLVLFLSQYELYIGTYVPALEATSDAQSRRALDNFAPSPLALSRAVVKRIILPTHYRFNSSRETVAMIDTSIGIRRHRPPRSKGIRRHRPPTNMFLFCLCLVLFIFFFL